MSDTQGSQGFYGQIGEVDANDHVNSHRFLTKQQIAHVRTGIPVKIVKVHGGGVGAPPTVDVQLQINQIDSQGNSTPHGIVYGIPVVRNQGGKNVVINDPVVGDVGHMVISDRDLTTIKNNAGAQSNPGSFRRHDMADGVYHAAFLNAAVPDNYINMNGSKVAIVSPMQITLTVGSSSITITSGSIVVKTPSLQFVQG